MKARILLIEDNPQNRYLTKFILEQRGHTITLANSGPEGLALAADMHPDLILLDIQLPGMDGYAVARALKVDPRLNSIPIVAATSFAMTGDREKCFAAGAQGYIEKPINPESFAQEIERFLQTSPPAPRGRPHVLIVDDQSEHRYMLRTLLQGNGFTIDEAGHGGEALEKAAANPPDLIISDLLMPTMDGFTLLRRWKADPDLQQIPFMVYTATYVEPRDERLAVALGTNAFVVKPAEPDALLKQIREVLVKNGKLSSSHEAPPDEKALIHEYNEILVLKLEAKTQQLEQFNRELQEEIAERRKIEAALAESEERYRNLFDSITDPLFVYDRETLAYLAVNDAAIKDYGYSREDFLSMTIKDIRPPEDVPALLEMLGRAAVKNVEQRGIWRHRKHDGCEFEVDISAYCLTYLGRPACLVSARDVTEQRRAERENLQTSRLLQAVADGTPDAFYVKDRQGKYLLFNEAAARFVGRNAADVIGKDDRALFRPEDAQKVITSDQSVMQSGRLQTVEEVLVSSDTPRTYLATKFPYRDQNGNIIGIIGTSRDITDRKRTEQALRLRDKVIQALSQGIIITDPRQPDNPIIYASEGVERITGYPPEEMLGRNCRFVQGRDTDPATVSQLRAAIAAGQSCAVEILNYRRSGDPFWNRLSLNPFHDEHGTLLHFVGILNDATDQKSLEQQLRQAQKMEAVGRLAGGIAHDFNNLLTIISGYSELLVEQPEVLQEAAGAITDASRRATELTKQLLGFSRLSLLEPRVLDLNKVVAETGTMLQRLIGEDIDFATVLDPQLSKVKVDPGQLSQVLMNLAVNARDAMPHGGRLTVETSNVVLSEEYAQTHLDCKAGPYVVLALTDTGCGMTPEVISRIFEPFYTTKELGKGTGLGLSMVFGIVQQSNGFIQVESEPDQGTTFKIYLPAANEPLATADALTARSPSRGTETILVVEDEERVRRLAVLSLQKHGYKVFTAASGREALEIVQAATEIKLVLTDVVMPNLSGPELAASLQQLAPRTKILYMSGYTNDTVVRHGLLAAEVDYIQKPFTPQGLAQKVREVLDGSTHTAVD